MKTLKELFLQTTWKQVLESLKRYYLEDVDDEESELMFEYVYVKLCNMKPVTRNDNMIIDIRWIKHNELSKGYYDVSGFKDETYYALDFTPWAEWLGMKVNERLFNQFTNEDIVAHCIWEMTFHGFEEEQIQEKKDDLNRIVEEVNNGKANLISFEE